jgi:hypothetical protein
MDLTVPQQTVLTNAENLAIAAAEAAALTASSLVQMGLYTNNIVPGRDTTLSTLNEATFGGYGRTTIAAWDGPYVDATGNSWITSGLQVFTADGTSSNQIYGSFLARENAGVHATATNAGNAGAYAALFTITNGGTLYESPPKVRLTGATGSGATAHAVLTAGVVTSIVLDTPGSAYTTYTVVIDPPMSLVAVNQFTAPIGMSLPTDAIVTNQEISIPPIIDS